MGAKKKTDVGLLLLSGKVVSRLLQLHVHYWRAILENFSLQAETCSHRKEAKVPAENVNNNKKFLKQLKMLVGPPLGQ